MWVVVKPGRKPTEIHEIALRVLTRHEQILIRVFACAKCMSHPHFDTFNFLDFVNQMVNAILGYTVPIASIAPCV